MLWHLYNYFFIRHIPGQVWAGRELLGKPGSPLLIRLLGILGSQLRCSYLYMGIVMPYYY